MRPVGFSICLGTRVQDRIVETSMPLVKLVGMNRSPLDLLGVQCLCNCNFAKLDGWSVVRPNLGRITRGIIRRGEPHQTPISAEQQAGVFRCKDAQIALTMVVLPKPGPPVMT